MNEINRDDLDGIAQHFNRTPRWVTRAVEDDFINRPHTRNRGNTDTFDWLYSPGTDLALRTLHRLEKLGYRGDALRFAWWYLGLGDWNQKVARYVATVLMMARKHRRVTIAKSIYADGLTIECEGDSMGSYVRAYLDELEMNTDTDADGDYQSVNRVRTAIAVENGLSPNEVETAEDDMQGALPEVWNDRTLADGPVPQVKMDLDLLQQINLASLPEQERLEFLNMFTPLYRSWAYETDRRCLQALCSGEINNNMEAILYDARPDEIKFARWTIRKKPFHRQRHKITKYRELSIGKLPKRERGRQGIPAPSIGLAVRAEQIADWLIHLHYQPGRS